MKIIEGVKKNAKTARWVGVLLIITGIVSIFAPLAAGISVSILVGILLAFGGISQLILAFRAGSFGEGLLVFLFGLLGAVVGFYMLAQPDVALASLTLVLAGYFFVTGILEVIGAFGARPTKGWGWLLFGGIMSVILGIIIWRQFPVSGVWAVGVLVGVQLLMNGITLLAIAGTVDDVATAVDEAV